MMVLGLETSCDETGVAVYDGSRGLLADLVHTQAKLHAAYGGVVPELASRDHVRKLVPLVNEALARARVTLADLDGVAYTAGPGLIGALLVGASFGRTLAFALGIPALAVHHMEAHLLAPLMASPTPTLPFVALLVSGGHTQLVRVDAIGRYTILGESVDDAAGEAFDKTAKLLGLPYPGGAELARLAESGDPARFRFPRPMTDRPGLDFSFSGLKTAALQTIRSLERLSPQGLSPEDRADVARGFEEAVVETLLIKCRRALDATGIDQLVLAGGVAANRRLRTVLAADLAASTYYPPLNLCTDNGAMIAFAGYQRLAAGENSGLVIDTRARWPLDELSAIADG